MGKKSKGKVTIRPALTPDNSAKRLKELHTNTMDTPSPMDYDIEHEMDFGARVEFEKAKSGSFSNKTNKSTKSNKSNISSSYSSKGSKGSKGSRGSKRGKGSNPARNKLRFQKVRSNDPSEMPEMDARPLGKKGSMHQYTVTAATNSTLHTMVIHSHNSGHTSVPPHADDDDEDTHEDTHEETLNGSGTDDGTGSDNDDREDTDNMLNVKRTEMKSGYVSGTNTIGMGSEYEYENEWYEPTLTDNGPNSAGRISTILKQANSEQEISTTEEIRNKMVIKLKGKDRKQLKRLSQALEIIKDDLGIGSDLENSVDVDPSIDNTNLYDPSHEYPISEYDLNSDAKSGKSNITVPRANIMGILGVPRDQDGDEKINETKMRRSPKNDMVIRGSDDEMETNTAIKQSELSHSYHNDSHGEHQDDDNDDDDTYDDNDQYQWIIKTLLKIDKKDGQKLVKVFKDNKVTDSRLKDLREQDWRDLIPTIGTRNELRKMYESSFPPAEGNNDT